MVGFTLLSRSYYYLRRRSPGPPFPPDHRQAGERGAIILSYHLESFTYLPMGEKDHSLAAQTTRWPGARGTIPLALSSRPLPNSVDSRAIRTCL